MDDTKILIVDDDETIRDLLATSIAEGLADCAVTIVQARDGVEALAMAEHVHPALIVIDVAMPNMDGLEVIRRLRANVTLRTASVLTVSATGDPAAAREAGCDHFLAKPFDLDELVQAVHTLMPSSEGPTRVPETASNERSEEMTQPTGMRSRRIVDIRRPPGRLRRAIAHAGRRISLRLRVKGHRLRLMRDHWFGSARASTGRLDGGAGQLSS